MRGGGRGAGWGRAGAWPGWRARVWGAAGGAAPGCPICALARARPSGPAPRASPTSRLPLCPCRRRPGLCRRAVVRPPVRRAPAAPLAGALHHHAAEPHDRRGCARGAGARRRVPAACAALPAACAALPAGLGAFAGCGQPPGAPRHVADAHPPCPPLPHLQASCPTTPGWWWTRRRARPRSPSRSRRTRRRRRRARRRPRRVSATAAAAAAGGCCRGLQRCWPVCCIAPPTHVVPHLPPPACHPHPAEAQVLQENQGAGAGGGRGGPGRHGDVLGPCGGAAAEHAPRQRAARRRRCCRPAAQAPQAALGGRAGACRPAHARRCGAPSCTASPSPQSPNEQPSTRAV